MESRPAPNGPRRKRVYSKDEGERVQAQEAAAEAEAKAHAEMIERHRSNPNAPRVEFETGVRQADGSRRSPKQPPLTVRSMQTPMRRWRT